MSHEFPASCLNQTTENAGVSCLISFTRFSDTLEPFTIKNPVAAREHRRGEERRDLDPIISPFALTRFQLPLLSPELGFTAELRLVTLCVCVCARLSVCACNPVCSDKFSFHCHEASLGSLEHRD